MVSVLPLPEWVPAWVHAVVLCSAAVLGLALLLMPFSVFGIKARLEAIEARLDEVQGEIRSLALRLPEPVADADDADVQYDQARPPIPPAPYIPSRQGSTAPLAMPARRTGRTEPRLY